MIVLAWLIVALFWLMIATVVIKIWPVILGIAGPDVCLCCIVGLLADIEGK
jgi:hypothetical protein